MATIIIRNSTGSGVIPSSLQQGELAINTKDGRLFYGSGSGNIVKEFTGSGGGSSTPTFPYTGSAIISGSLVVTGSLQVGVPGVNLPAIDSTVGTLSRGTQTKIDWVNAWLVNSSGLTVVDWESALLNDGSGNSSVDASSRLLYDTSLVNSIDWESRFILDTAGTRAIAYGSRYLIYPDGTTTAINYGTQNQISMTGSVSVTGSFTVSGSSTFRNIGPAEFTGSVSSLNGFTGSLQGTASYALAVAGGGGAFPYTGDASITGSLTIKDPSNGFNNFKVSSSAVSYILKSGVSDAYKVSTGATVIQAGQVNNQPYAVLGDVDAVGNGTTIIVQDDGASIQLNGNTTINGPLTATSDATIEGGLLTARVGATVTGSLKVTGGITGSLLGTASYATNAASVNTLKNFISTTDSSGLTGTTSSTLVRSVLIPANSVAVGDLVFIRVRARKSGTAGNFTQRLYVNTSAAIGGSLVGTSTTMANTGLYQQIYRTLAVKSSTVTETMQAGGLALTDDVVLTGAVANNNINWTVDQYLIVAHQNGSIADTTTNSFYHLQIQKA